MKFIDVNPDEIPNLRDSRRGRVSYPLLKSFLETNKFVVKVDTEGISRSKSSLTASLSSYIRGHSLPIKIFQRGGELYFMRLDMDEHGNKIENWLQDQIKEHIESQQPEVDLTTITPKNKGK